MNLLHYLCPKYVLISWYFALVHTRIQYDGFIEAFSDLTLKPVYVAEKKVISLNSYKTNFELSLQLFKQTAILLLNYLYIENVLYLDPVVFTFLIYSVRGRNFNYLISKPRFEIYKNSIHYLLLTLFNDVQIL